jgi:hypothetical protein
VTWQLALDLDLEPTIAMLRGDQRVDQCAWCGTVVVAPGGRSPLGPCPSCAEPRWWRQELPIAGLSTPAIDDELHEIIVDLEATIAMAVQGTQADDDSPLIVPISYARRLLDAATGRRP